MRIATLVVIGALLMAGIMWIAAASNQMYLAQDGNIGFRSQPGVPPQILAGLDDNHEFTSNQMSNLVSAPPIDSKVPAKLQVATFSLG